MTVYAIEYKRIGMGNEINKIETLKKLSLDDRALFAEILTEELVNTGDIERRAGYSELVESDLINSWIDDGGSKMTQIGRQLYS